ncbi:hypothetical protein HKCCD6035_04090 [Rhodobacterales bacterium HKCCD6035]|nr:hypothetical protein [Rhodobacterales bacterium HKCCD6035]
MNDQSMTHDMAQKGQIDLKARYARSQVSIKQQQLKREAAGYAVGAFLGWFGEMTSGKGPLACAVCLSKAACATFAIAAPIYFLSQMM